MRGSVRDQRARRGLWTRKTHSIPAYTRKASAIINLGLWPDSSNLEVSATRVLPSTTVSAWSQLPGTQLAFRYLNRPWISVVGHKFLLKCAISSKWQQGTTSKQAEGGRICTCMIVALTWMHAAVVSVFKRPQRTRTMPLVGWGLSKNRVSWIMQLKHLHAAPPAYSIIARLRPSSSCGSVPRALSTRVDMALQPKSSADLGGPCPEPGKQLCQPLL